jgi:hypothetical protein
VNTYTLINTPPSVEAYMHLREVAGLSPKSLQAATLGLAGTWYGVHIRDASDTIAMGRIIGDGGCFFQVSVCWLMGRPRASTRSLGSP